MISIFTVYDSKAESYMNPFFAQATGAGIRSFSAACNTPEHDFHKYPEDFTLFEIGLYEPLTGEIETFEAKRSLGLALDFIDQAAPVETTRIQGVN